MRLTNRGNALPSILLVTLILAVLAYFLVGPLFDTDRERGRRLSCLSNLKSLTMAMMRYAQDNDDRLPASTAWSSVPYISNFQILRCPADGPHDLVSYALPTRWSSASLAHPPGGPELMLILYESDAAGPAYRHNEGLNLAFGDGHAKWASQSVFAPQMATKGRISGDLWD